MGFTTVARALWALALGGVCLAGVPATPVQAQDGGLPERLDVWAAASLTDVLPVVARAWEARGGAPVRFSFAGTSRIATQIDAGAPADVFVSADRDWMEWLLARGGVRPESVLPLAANRLVVVMPAVEIGPGEGPGAGFATAESLGPLVGATNRIALAGANVPAGRYAEEALRTLTLWEVVQERTVRAESVRGAVEWVARGEAEVGFVYRTDALAEPRVRIVAEISPGDHQEIVYPAGVVAGSTVADEAAAFLAFATGEIGQSIFEAEGFSPPDPTRNDLQSRALQAAALGQDDRRIGEAIRLSLTVALAAVLLGLIPAVALGWLLARKSFPGKGLVSTVVLAPLVLPPVVTGVLLLEALGRNSLIGGALASWGLPVPFTLLGAVVAAGVVGLPLYVVSIRTAFESVDPRLEEVAWTLGQERRPTFFRVTLPLALPGILAGAVLAFARALGEFGATIVLAGNIPGETRTIALAVYTLLESPSAADGVWILVAASVVLSLAALLLFELLNRRLRKGALHG